MSPVPAVTLLVPAPLRACCAGAAELPISADPVRALLDGLARTLYGDGTPKAGARRQTQLNRLWHDGVDQVIESLRFLAAHQRTAAKRTAVLDLHRYLTTNRERMRYHTYRAAGISHRQWRGGKCGQPRRATADETRRHALARRRR